MRSHDRYTLTFPPVGSVLCLSWYTVVWLKMISYTQVNWWCRNSPIRKKDGMYRVVVV